MKPQLDGIIKHLHIFFMFQDPPEAGITIALATGMVLANSWDTGCRMTLMPSVFQLFPSKSHFDEVFGSRYF
ncbi:MAG: hypothetical protein V2I34_09740 [Bacteroidales bacterium]|nr:hypothetical protein [Bacteroidales bacterium]